MGATRHSRIWRQRAACVVLAAATVAAVAVGRAAGASASSLERVTESVVAITAGADRIGTGFVVAADRVLTVAHVAEAAAGRPASVLVRGRMVPFEVVALDKQRDLALLVADVPDDVPVAIFGDSAALARGQDVIALGFPIGLSSVSLTKGVVSSPLQRFAGAYFVQTDAAINPGNSGGPLVDEQGRVIGVNVAKVAQVEVDAVGFAVPAADVIAFIERVDPEAAILVDRTPGSAGGPPVAWRSPAAVAGMLALAAIVALVLVWRRRRASGGGPEPEDEEGEEGSAGEPARVRPRAVFRIVGAGRGEERDVRLPAVAGSAPNADLPVGEGAAAYHVRFSPAGTGVTALDLTDERGMYCGDRCVRSVVLRSGESVRVAGTTITLLSTYDGESA